MRRGRVQTISPRCNLSVATTMGGEKGALRLLGAGFFEEAGEVGEFGLCHVAELLPVEFVDGLVELGEEVESLLCDGHEDHAAVVGGALAGGEAHLFEAVDDAGDIGDLGDHHRADLGARLGRAALVAAAEDAKAVVEGLGEFEGLEAAVELGGEDAVGAEEVEVGLLLGGVEGASLADLGGEAAGGRAGRAPGGGLSVSGGHCSNNSRALGTGHWASGNGCVFGRTGAMGNRDEEPGVGDGVSLWSP